MYKRPQIRVREPSMTTSSRPAKGSFLYRITNPEKTQFHEMEPYYIHDYDTYIKNLKKSCEASGAEFKIPKYARPLPVTDKRIYTKPKLVEYSDDVIVRINVLKCGKVRVKLLTHMATLYEKYFSKAKKPPVKVLAAALKAVGYGDEYVSKLPESLTKQKENMEIRWKKLDAVFNKPSTSNTKKKAKKKEPEPEPEEEEEEEEEENEDDDAAPEEEALDVDNDDEDEEVVEEEYFSDAE
jgi:hypothetical protein